MGVISVGAQTVRDWGVGEYEQRCWIYCDDLWRDIHSGAMRRSRYVLGRAHTQDKIIDLKVIAKIPPENTHHLMAVIKHNECA